MEQAVQEVKLSSRKKFVDLAEKRVNRAIRDLRLVGNLSNRSNYSYSEEDVKKIFAALEREIRSQKQRFEAAVGGQEAPLFKLSE